MGKPFTFGIAHFVYFHRCGNEWVSMCGALHSIRLLLLLPTHNFRFSSARSCFIGQYSDLNGKKSTKLLKQICMHVLVSLIQIHKCVCVFSLFCCTFVSMSCLSLLTSTAGCMLACAIFAVAVFYSFSLNSSSIIKWLEGGRWISCNKYNNNNINSSSKAQNLRFHRVCVFLFFSFISKWIYVCTHWRARTRASERS